MLAKNNQIVFLCYEARSGSTYLSSELSKYKDIFVSIEDSIPFGLPLIEYFHYDKDKIYNILINDKKFKAWNISDTYIKEIVYSDDSASTIFEKIVDKNTKIKNLNSKIFIYKMPIKPILFHKCKNLYPDAKFIHLYRDPRAVYLSQLSNFKSNTERSFTQNPVEFSKVWLKNFNFYKRNFYKSENKNFFEFSYEEFIINHNLTKNRILSFLSSSKDIIENINYNEQIPISQIHLHPNIGKKPLKENIDNWKHTLSAEQIFIIQDICKKIFIEKDYIKINLNRLNYFNYKILNYYFIYYLSIIIKILKLLGKPKGLILRLKMKFYKL